MHPPLDGTQNRGNALKRTQTMKRYDLTLPENAPHGRLISHLSRTLPQVPFYALREAFQKRDVKVNGKRVGMDAMVLPGGEITLFVRETPAMAIPVVYQDDNLMIVVKPAGISCDADARGGQTLPALVHEQILRTDPSAQEPLLCHRLDNPTEGLLILAKTAEAQGWLEDAFRQRQIHKEYICLVRGTPSPAHRRMNDWLVKDAKHARVRISARELPGAKAICTEYTVLEAGTCSRLRIQLHTGRTHQIRAHMAYMGHPLLGDDLYGNRTFNRDNKAKRLMLCSCVLCFATTGPLAYLNGQSFTIQPTF